MLKEREKEGETPQQGSFRINGEGVQEWTQELNTKGNPVWDIERGLCEEAAQSSCGGESFFGRVDLWVGGWTGTVMLKQEGRGKDGKGV